jgi:cyanamide hydratase
MSAITEFGFDPVVRSPEKLLERYHKESPYIPVDEIQVPTTPLAVAVEAYVREQLSPQTYNHSVRVYYYGRLNQSSLTAGIAMLKIHFPQWKFTPEVPWT